METIEPALQGAKFPSRQSLKCEGFGAVMTGRVAPYPRCLTEMMGPLPSLRGTKRRSNPDGHRGKDSGLLPPSPRGLVATLATTEYVPGRVAAQLHRARRKSGKVPGLFVLAARDRDRRIRLGARAFHVEPPVTHGDLVAAQEAHPLQAACRARRGVVLRHGEDDRRHRSHQ